MSCQLEGVTGTQLNALTCPPYFNLLENFLNDRSLNAHTLAPVRYRVDTNGTKKRYIQMDGQTSEVGDRLSPCAEACWAQAHYSMTSDALQWGQGQDVPVGEGAGKVRPPPQTESAND